MRAFVGAVTAGSLLMSAVVFNGSHPAQGASAFPEPPTVHRGPTLPAGLSSPQKSGVVARAGVPTSNLPASRYAALSSEACLAELDARGIEYTREDREGVDTPVRFTSALSGVTFRTLRSKEERARTPFEVFDCRLVLAISDFAKILVRHNVTSVMYFSAYRPHVPGGPARAHQRALAIDIAFFGLESGKAYSVLRDFTPIAGERPCEPRIKATGPRELRAIACEAAKEGVFHVTITPDYNEKHRDHFHMEIDPDAATAYAR